LLLYSVDLRHIMFKLCGRLLLLFTLLFVGLCFSALGLHTPHLVGVTVFGGAFVLLSAFALRKSVPPGPYVGALAGLLLGALVGAGTGSLFSDAANWFVGIIAGAIIGAISGAVVFVVIFEHMVGVLPAHLGIHRFPKAASIIILIPLTLGALAGIEGFRDILPKAFGAAGSGAVSGGVVGMLIGMLVGMRIALGTGIPVKMVDARSADKP
jgi:hypothetical protein